MKTSMQVQQIAANLIQFDAKEKQRFQNFPITIKTNNKPKQNERK